MHYNKFTKETEHLTDFDKRILGIILNSPLPYLDVLHKQLCAATITHENLITNYFLDFNINIPVDPIPTSTMVPVTIDMCPNVELTLPTTTTFKYYETTGTAHLLETSGIFFEPKDDNLYVGILMHFKDGIIQEIEVVNWAGISLVHCINRVDISKWVKIFRYNDKQWFEIVMDKEHLN